MTKNELLSLALKITKAKNSYPDLSDLARENVSRDQVRKLFGNLDGLKDHIAEESSNILDLGRSELNNKIDKSKKTFVITTAVTGAKVDTNFLANIDAYCKKFNAQLLVLVSILDNKSMLLDPVLQDRTIIVGDTALNSNISILGIKNSAKRADPITGLPRIGRRNTSIVSASPKQRLKFVPTGMAALPHALMSTGAITLPSYSKTSVMVAQNDYMAQNDHVMGALVVELSGEQFHFRQIQAGRTGSFTDLGTHVNRGRISKMAPSAFILGDWHSGSTDPKVVASLTEITKKLDVQSWVLHDLFDGLSVNPHTEDKNIIKAQLAKEGKLNLESELEQLKKDMTMMSKLVPKVVVVRSNHDDFLDRYLNKGEYVEDHVNHRVSLDLAIHLIEGHNPLEAYVGKMKNVRWLKLDESYKISGFECGMHGHLGANGARGSITSMEQAYGKVIFGHSHTAQILRDSINVGTSTFLELGYNKGASSWTQTSCLVYPDGSRQLINFIEGKYTTRKL